MKDIIITTIPAEAHYLPGIGDFEYYFNRAEKKLTIKYEGTQLAELVGEQATETMKKVIDVDNEIDGEVIDVERRAKKAFGMTIRQLSLDTRRREIVEYRQICMWYMAYNTRKSLAAIGAVFGGYDHATVLHARKTIDNLFETDMKVKMKVERFLKED